MALIVRPEPGSRLPAEGPEEPPFHDRGSGDDFSRPEDYAALYHGCTPEARFFNQRLDYVVRYLASFQGGKLLDVGCGPGILLQKLAGSKFELFGIDHSLEMVQEAKARTADQRVCLEVGQVEHLPYRGRIFDIVLALGVLEYASDIGLAIGELARVAKPDATIIISMLNGSSIYWLSRLHGLWPWADLRPPVAAGSGNQGPTRTIYRKAHLIEIMREHRIRPDNVIYYGVNVCIEPLGSRYPRLSVCINRMVGFCLGNMLRPRVHTAFLIIASIMLEV
ncbi:MAG: class I SAM-dependent methyltransferase [Acetobacteraceae bacterium]